MGALHVRLDDELHAAVQQRAAAVGVSLNTWVVRALVHAVEHGKTSGEPAPLRLPWSALL